MGMIDESQLIADDKIREGILENLVVETFDGKVESTVTKINKQGFRFRVQEVRMMLQRYEVREAIATRITGSSELCQEKLQRFWDKVMTGQETDGYETVHVREEIEPGADDFDPDLPLPQYRHRPVTIPKRAKMPDRLKASELLGRSMGVFVERMEVKHEFSIAEILDDDLKPIDKSPVLDIDKGELMESSEVDELLLGELEGADIFG